MATHPFLRGGLSVALALSLVGTALADKVATLHARGTAPLAERTSMRTSTELAAQGLGHVSVAEAEVLQGEGAAGDAIGTSAGLVAVGKTTGADWVVVPSLATSASVTRIELQVCQVSTGRVETLARDLDPKVDPTLQVREMLVLLLRPQGVGDDPLPWDQPKKPAPSASASAPAPSAPLAPVSAEPPSPPHYGEGGAIALGAGGGVVDVVARPKDARGSRLAFTWNAAALFALPSRPWLEIVARVAGVHGPGNAIAGDLGARATYVGRSRFSFGGELALGAFGQLGGAQTAQLSLSVSPVVSVAITRAFGLDLRPLSLRLATGADAGSVALLGADLTAFLRF